jgi:AraC family transcriptional regulator
MSCRSGTLEGHRRAVSDVIEIMRGDLGAHLDLARMAAAAYMSHYHFLRVFEEVTHISPIRFLAALRIQDAKRMLLETALPITAICFETGYNSLGTFTRIFTESVGVNPSSFRRLGETIGGRSIAELIGRYLDRDLGSGCRRAVSGWVRGPADFAGPIFVGVFSSPIPQQRPMSGCVLEHAGRFELGLEASDTACYLMAAGFPAKSEGISYLLGSREVLVAAKPLIGCGAGSADLVLRPVEALDPPILIALPMLLGQ